MTSSGIAGDLFDPALRVIVVWDFDRTLLDTFSFTYDLIGCLSTDSRAQRHLAELEHRATNTVRFDPFELLAPLGISHEELSELLRAYTEEQHGPGHTYLYPDVVPAITRISELPYMHQEILTTGGEETQRFKLGLCPPLQHIPQTVTEGNKGELLERCFLPDGQISYQDQIYHAMILGEDTRDAILAIRRRPSFLAVHVLRPDTKYPEKTGRRDPDVVEVRSLEELPGRLSGWLERQRAS